MKIKLIMLIIASFLFFNPFCRSQSGDDQSAVNQTVVSHQDKKIIIEWVCEKLHENYIYPDTAEKMSAFVERRFNEGKYKNANSHLDFRRALTQDLQTVSKDAHLKKSDSGIVWPVRFAEIPKG